MTRTDLPAFSDTFRSFSEPGIRSRIRYAVLSALGVTLAAKQRYEKAVCTPRIQFLCLHHVFPDEEESFGTIIRFLARHHNFLNYSEAVERIRSGSIDRPYIVFSFDDGFRCCLRAAEILHDHGVSACFFINPSVIGATEDARTAAYCQNRLRVRPVPFLSVEELHRTQCLGHEIGYHTWSHRRSSELREEDYALEFQEGRQILEEWVGPVQHFAWPFGKLTDFNQSVMDELENLSFSSIASAERGCHLPHSGAAGKHAVVRRDPFVAHWPLSHLRYFLLRSIEKARSQVYRCY